MNHDELAAESRRASVLAGKAPVAPTTNGAGPEVDEVAAIRRALLEDPQDTRDASGPAREEVPGTGGLGYRGMAASCFGESGEGKSIVATTLGLSAAAAGEKVLYLDRENGAALTRDRIEDILDAHENWGDPLADGRFVGRHYPELRANWSPGAFGEAIAGAGFTVVIFDSVREMLAQLGIDAHRGDVSPFITMAVSPLVRRGLFVALLDNVGHVEKRRPKGDGGKLDAVPQAYQVRSSVQFSPVLTGRITITCTRSRYGDTDREWTMRVGGGVFDVPETRGEAPDAKVARQRHEGRETFRKACITVLREQSPLGRDPLIKAARRHGAKGRNEKLRKWLVELAADPTSGILPITGEGYALDVPATPGPDDVGQGGATPLPGPPGPPGPHPYGGPGLGTPGPADAGHPHEAGDDAALAPWAEEVAARYPDEAKP